MAENKLTRERFHELLNAYMGAMDHASWVAKREGSTSQAYHLAVDAAVRALNDLERAVFG